MYPITKTLLILSLLILVHSHEAAPHKCIHDQLEFKPEFMDVPIADTFDGRALQSSYQNIRIYFDFSPSVNLSSDYMNYIKNVIIPPVENFWEAALSVVPVSGNLTGQKQTTMCSGTVTVPSIYNTTGVPADLVLFVDTVNDTTQDYVAFAGPCILSTKNYRPLFGRVVYNLAKIKPTNSSDVTIERDISVSLHEITHALGFSDGLYTNYINPQTNQKLTNHLFTQIVNNYNITVLNVEPLTTRLRQYFGCDTLTGAYIEQEGGSGSRGSHFERRILYNEYMTASTVPDSRVSQFALALLEGSGWYQVNYSMAEPMTWGKGKGCDFLNTPCVSKTTNTTVFEEYCSPLRAVGCSWTGRGAGSCGTTSLRTNSLLDPAFDYWYNKTIVNDNFADNCPIYTVYSNIDCEDSTLQTKSTLSSYEFYGQGGKCFIGTLYKPGATISTTGYCFKPTCNLQADGTYTLTVAVGNNTVSCLSESKVSVTGLTGKLNCPDPTKYCKQINSEGDCRRGCSARGTCVNRQCKCMDGWTGYDCSRKVYTDNCAKCSGSGSDSLRTSCYGDICECNPSNSTCMCQLGLKTGPECVTTTTTNEPSQNTTTTTTTTTNEPKMQPTSQPAEPTSQPTVQPTAQPTPQPSTNEPASNPTNSNDGATQDNTNTNQVNSNGDSGSSNTGLVIGGVVAGVVVVVAGFFFVYRYIRRLKLARSSSKTAPIKKQPSFANPTLQRQMTANQAKYAIVP